MINLLHRKYSHPLEREYEAWIVAGIERYFMTLGVKFAIWAVSPNIEAVWPADEQLNVARKVVGLQFKQAKMAPGAIGPNRLKWSLNQPPGQFALVQGAPEVFYCLPTFINREARSEALHHCLFWRPGRDANHNAWYDNPAAHTPYRRIRDSMRWGHFLESLIDCSIGVRAETPAELINAVEAIRARVFGDRVVHNDPNREEPDTGLYILVLDLEG